jgi:hypothetical protein
MPALTIEYRDKSHRIAQALAIAYITQLRQIGVRVGQRLDHFAKAIDDLERAWHEAAPLILSVTIIRLRFSKYSTSF